MEPITRVQTSFNVRKGFSKAQSTAKFLIAALIILFLCVLILLAIGGVFFIPVKTSVFIINGLENPYQVKINDMAPVTVTPGVAQEIETSDSNLKVQVISDDYDIADYSFKIDTRLYKKFMSDDVFVLNPDATEVIMKDTVIYEDQINPPTNTPPTPITYYTGEQSYQIEGIDYAFTKSPDYIELGDFQSYDLKTELRLYDNFEYWGDTFTNTLSELPEYKTALLNRYEYDKDWSAVKFDLQSIMDEAEYMELARENLTFDPFNVPEHREYQNFLIKSENYEELDAYYQGILDQYPNDKDLMYLMARIEVDPVKSRELAEMAIQEPNASYWGHNLLGFDTMANGEYRKAKAHFDAFMEKATDEEDYVADSHSYFMDYALQNYEKIRKENRDYIDEYGYDDDVEFEEIIAVSLMRNWAEAERLRKELYDYYKDYDSAEYAAEQSSYAEALIHSIKGEHDLALRKYLDYYGDFDDGSAINYAEYLIKLNEGKPREAYEAYYGQKTEDSYEGAYMTFDRAIVLAAFAHRAGDLALEKQLRQEAAELMPEIYGYTRQLQPVKEWLEGNENIDPGTFLDIPMYPYNKVSLLMYIGEVAPAYRQQAWGLAMKLKIIPSSMERSVFFPFMGYNGPLIPNPL